ncbi:hypothetical protein AVEN_3157-1 [Araneus ventricosus]|uniref:Uncharacterized protein n=1 Tax=Araneus ventricosus TaxID=182803 RepID=A0A4Y2WDL5_ARAVE|nr:hypothetical protein AVEN_3157-1 [Araneus ventricosus]
MESRYTFVKRNFSLERKSQAEANKTNGMASPTDIKKDFVARTGKNSSSNKERARPPRGEGKKEGKKKKSYGRTLGSLPITLHLQTGVSLLQSGLL